ncbi:hypothetical protein B9Z19DRAFT_1117411 [Tuber borchii]|uniref:NADH:ubiquinone oxidoreductase 20.1kD subunit n=1 Tax=Tuber borchii TaxID=42251 RepID=A0A2T6ZCU0_TUBBO|nr:hypothetical protein B9Z19DRAFT_1117411 [Tuber borchii]
MFAQRVSMVRPLAYRTLPLLSSHCTRTFITGYPRIPQKFEQYPNFDDATDPGMNGGYVNPPAEKRQFRDPYADWWDKQGRRNFGEPLHEDDDLLGRFTPEEYTHFKPRWAFAMNGIFIATMLGFCGVVYALYPDMPAVPRTFPHDGLLDALGGPGALPALPDKDDK